MSLFFKITLDKDCMTAVLGVSAQGEKELSSDSISKEIKSLDISHGIDQTMLDRIAGMSDEEKLNEKTFVIAKGTPAKDGKKGELDYKVDIENRFKIPFDDERVDYKEAMKIESVKKGDLLCVLVPPVEGVPGKNLKSVDIPANKGAEATLKAGKNVEQKGDQFLAQCEGIIVLVGDLLSVSPIYEVKGDVSMETGNITFTGTVIISGDVPDDFKIETGGDLFIGGTVGNAQITCGGSLEIRGGIHGKEKGLIVSNGCLVSKFINQVDVECDGDVLVEKEINNCNLKTLGEIKIPNGVIMGGKCISLQSVEAGYIGSELGVRTVLEVGTHYKMASLDVKLRAVHDKFDDIRRKIDPYMGTKGKKPLSKKARNTIEDLHTTFSKTKPIWLELKEAKQQYKAALAQRNPEVTVLKTLYTDVILKSFSCVKTFSDQLLGPFVVYEDVNRSTMVVKKEAS